jgi:predicted deacetylase
MAFCVVVHDVAPVFWAELERIVDALAGAGCVPSAAVVPCWHGAPLDAGFAAFVRARFGEVLLHGYTHRARAGLDPLAWLTRGGNEFSRRDARDAAARLAAGQAALAAAFGAPAAGFVPPAWQSGALSRASLAAAGLSFYAGFFRLERADGRVLPLATLSWDAGRVAALGLAGEWAGRVRAACDRRAVVCVVLHPADVGRGFLPGALRRIAALARIDRPLALGELAACAR